MSKAILVIDMPKNCNECRCFNDAYQWCNNVSMLTNGKRTVRLKGLRYGWQFEEKLPDCPLKPMPEKLNEKDLEVAFMKDKVSIVKLYQAHGYNACIDELLGEE